MLEIQLFEFTLVGLVQAQGDDLKGSPDYRRFIEELFTLTAGQLRRRAKIEDDELAELLESTVQLRNTLVHGWLIYAGMDGVAGVRTTAEQREHLRSARRAIHDVRTALDAQWQKELAGLEGDELTLEKVFALCRGAPQGSTQESD